MIRKKTLAAIAAGILFLGVLIPASGLVPLGAISGHFAATEWLLQFTKRRTVKVRSSRIVPPPLDARSRILRGAGHFDVACRPCHGSPGIWQPVVLRNMLPFPPKLSDSARKWETEELFWIVKNGLKLTGMPGWPSPEREDEVWDVTAFVLRLPAMKRPEYRELAGLTLSLPADAPLSAANCARCHGVDGQGRGGAAPRIAGQRPAYILCALDAYAGGRRSSGIMETVAGSLTRDEMKDLALYYAGLPPPTKTGSDPAQLSIGEEIVHRGIPGQKVPSCADCHGPGTRPRRAAYPNLAGQHESYLQLQLQLFRKGIRGGSPFARLMHPVARGLSQQQIEDVTRYYASLTPEPPGSFEGTEWGICEAEYGPKPLTPFSEPSAQ